MQNKFFTKRITGIITILDGNKGVDRLTTHLVIHTHNGSFTYSFCINCLAMIQYNIPGLGPLTVFDEGRFNFGGGQSMPTHIHHVVDTATDPIISFVIPAGPITCELKRY